ncbi:MAG: hypothetical protein V4548_09860 [Bacteroidota bacterium]
MKRLLKILLIIYGINLNAQVNILKFNLVVNKFNTINQTLVFDEIQLENFNEKKNLENRIFYNDFKTIFTNENNEPSIVVSDTIFNRFYSVGKIELPNKQIALLIIHVSELKKFEYIKTAHYGIFNDKGKMTWFSNLSSNNKNSIDRATLLNDFTFIIKENSDMIYSIYEMEEFISEECTINEKCMNYKVLFDKIPLSNDLNMSFTSDKVQKLSKIIPLKFCSPYTPHPLLTMLDKEKIKSHESYFLGAKKIMDNKKIIFFINRLVFDSYKDVSEVNYIIIDNNGIIKIDSLSEFCYDKDGNQIINYKGRIKDLDDKIEIIKYYGNETKILTFNK